MHSGFQSDFCLYLIFLSCLCSYHSKSFSFAASLSNVTDHLSLLKFKEKITNDPFNVLSSWNSSIHFCNWHGVTCGRRHRRVTRLRLSNSTLEGTISPHIGNLSFLMSLGLRYNNFEGVIPLDIGRLHRLKILDLPYNLIDGEIPQNISGCINLMRLDLRENNLAGIIPMGLSSLSKLREVIFQGNNLVGSVSHLGNLSSLEVISLSKNTFGGTVPDSLAKLSKLVGFSIFHNNFSGIISPLFFNISSLVNLDLGTNKLKGTLPVDMFYTLPNLRFFSVSHNQFTGTIPMSLSNASNLRFVQLSVNQFEGTMPLLGKLNKLESLMITRNLLGKGDANDLLFLSSLTNSTNLQNLGIAANGFGDVLPESIGNLSRGLQSLFLGSNKIYGEIPVGITNLVNLQALSLACNRLSGSIPPDIVKLRKLNRLYLCCNKFTGRIPSSIGNLTELANFSIDNNSLSGSIPISFENCKKLKILRLSFNNLNGCIPPGVSSLSSLVELDLQHNRLHGFLPQEVGNLQNLVKLLCSNNMLSGKIPSTLRNCLKLEYLYLDANYFEGIIPQTLGVLRGIKELDLSQNNLSGKIPTFFEIFGVLEILNLSYNKFEGQIPTKGIFRNATATSLTGNKKLCGGLAHFRLPPCKSRDYHKEVYSPKFRLIIIIASGLLGVVLVMTLLCVFRCRFRNKRKEALGSDSDSALDRISYNDLHKATEGFSSTKLIGMGSFGSVYKGILDQGRITVAVKVLNLLRHGASKSFLAECNALKNIRHRNILKILTVCSSVDYNGNNFKALVYDFMANGSLEDWLHPSSHRRDIYPEPMSLNLRQRLNIAIDVANALEYLHHNCEPVLVHCDIKPSNVLLDDEIVGYLGDFGLAKNLLEASDSASQSSSIAIKGTIGYAAPEYGMGSQISPCGDIYSFGILLLEMFTGKAPTDDFYTEETNLHNYVKATLPDQIQHIMDPVLTKEMEEEIRDIDNFQYTTFLEGLISIFEVGINCSAKNPRERMGMNDVVAILNTIRGKLFGTQRRLVIP